MAMSRKHYEAVAEILSGARDTYNDGLHPDAIDAIDHLTRELGTFFYADNGRFDRGRFERATR